MKTINKFCSRKCNGKRIENINRIKNLINSPTAKKNHLIKVKSKNYKDKMSKVMTGIIRDINGGSGAGENNSHAKTWWIIKNKKHYKFKNLSKFVRDNKILFSEDELKEYNQKRRYNQCLASVMLRNLYVIKKDGTPLIPSQEWHGWTIVDKI